MEVAGKVGRVLPIGEDEDRAARLGVSVGVRVVQRLFWGCGWVFSFIRWQCQGGVGPSGFSVWESPKGRIIRVMGYVFFRPQGKGHGATVYDSLDLEAIAKRVV